MPDADRRPEEQPSLPLVSYPEERPCLPLTSYPEERPSLPLAGDPEEPMVLEPSKGTTLTLVPYEGESGSSQGAADPSLAAALPEPMSVCCGQDPHCHSSRSLPAARAPSWDAVEWEGL
ncbi:hypothetical protein UY3_04095 [Chelonia mydas]|uniref:Uncharacterized protein n=1 Tax=Chelonia mydas TaxID=8469 RepID=M7BLK9_CHEMY|nr:hypothetical protein UY3_04095 [Chelonia mydas]